MVVNFYVRLFYHNMEGGINETKIKKTLARASVFSLCVTGVLAAAITLVELVDAAFAVHGAALTGVGRVRLAIDEQAQLFTILAVSGAGQVLGTISHDNFDGVVLGMNALFHICHPKILAKLFNKNSACPCKQIGTYA